MKDIIIAPSLLAANFLNLEKEITRLEEAKIKEAYEKSMIDKNDRKLDQNEYVLYGTYEPFTVTLTHILNNKSGVNFGSYAHTGLPVEVLVKGVGAEDFSGYYDNTDIYNRLASLLDVK